MSKLKVWYIDDDEEMRQAVGLMLPHVVRMNANVPAAAVAYSGLARVAHLPCDGHEPRAASAVLADCLDQLLEAAQLSRSLTHFGVQNEQVALLAEEAARTVRPRVVCRRAVVLSGLAKL